MARRLQQTLVDYVVIAISPALIMTLVGSLMFFLLEVFYQGDYQARLSFIVAMFVMAAVLIARISMEEGAAYAAAFAAPLAAVSLLAMSMLVEFRGALAGISWLINVGLIVLIWWCAHKLTWDCTLIDERQDCSGEGLLQTVGLDRRAAKKAQPPTVEQPPLEGVTGGETPKTWWERQVEKSKRPHAPGVWVVYFSLAALPLFGVGQWFIPATNEASRRYAFMLLCVYVASGLALLTTTSLLGLRRYLRQRQLQMPAPMVGLWLTVGAGLIVALLAFSAILPRPNAEYAAARLPAWADSPDDLRASRIALGKEGVKDDQADSPAVTSQNNTDEPTGRRGGEGRSQNQQPQQGASSGGGQGGESEQSGGQSSSPGEQGRQGGSRGEQSGQSQSTSDAQQGDNSAGQSATSQSGGDQQSGGRQGESQSGNNQNGGGQNADSPSGSGASQGAQSNNQDSSGQQRSGEQNGGRQGAGQSRDSQDDGAQKADSDGGGQSEDQDTGGAERPQNNAADSRDQDRSGQPGERGRQEPRSGPQFADENRSQRDQQNSSNKAEDRGQSRSDSRGSNSSPNIGQLASNLGGFLGNLLKLLFYAALVAAAIYLAWKYREQIRQAIAKLMRDLRNLWDRLLGRRRRQAGAQAGEAAPAAAPRPFASFSDPFLTGAAARLSSVELLRYSFEALEAWARDYDTPRAAGQTPMEFAAQLATRRAGLRIAARNLADLYCRAAYAREAAHAGTNDVLRQFWSQLRSETPAPAA